MKKLLPLLTLLLLIVSCSKPIDEESLVQRNGVYYKVNSETPYSGKSFMLHDNGQIYYERSFKEGKQFGLETLWYKSGQKREEGNWNENGKQDGLYTIWYKNGQKKSEVIFKDGERRSKTNWYKNGQKLSQWSSMSGSIDVLETNWYENGKKKYEKTFKDGKQISIKEWNEDGFLKE